MPSDAQSGSPDTVYLEEELAQGLAGLQPRDSILIGRGVECDIRVKDAKASRRHCRLARSATAFMLEDLGSKNGTYVKGTRIDAPVILHPRDSFQIGSTIFYLS